MEQAYDLPAQPPATVALAGPLYGEGRWVRQYSCPSSYGHVRLRIESLGGLGASLLIWGVAEDEIPRCYVPAIVAALREILGEAADHGLAVGDLKISVIGGSWHPVDSHGRAYARAAQLAFRAALARCDLRW